MARTMTLLPVSQLHAATSSKTRLSSTFNISTWSRSFSCSWCTWACLGVLGCRHGFNNLQSRLSRMATALKPLYVTVTWGAGGSTSSKSLELAEICQRQLGLPTVLHLTCTNMMQGTVDDALRVSSNLPSRISVWFSCGH